MSQKEPAKKQKTNKKQQIIFQPQKKYLEQKVINYHIIIFFLFI